MKEKQNDGGRAFPDPEAANPTTDLPWNCDKGMTLWHFFAAAALEGLCASRGCNTRPDITAELAADAADAMIKESQRRFPAS